MTNKKGKKPVPAASGNRLQQSDRLGPTICPKHNLRRSARGSHQSNMGPDQAGLQLKPAAKAKLTRAGKGFARRPDERFRMGDRTICDQFVGLFRRCRCGSEYFPVFEGIGAHSAQLSCDSCAPGGRWLARH
jgi:hypothetical protein